MSPSPGLSAQGCWLLMAGGGGTARDWKFQGCEGGLMRSRSLPSPRAGFTLPVLLSPPHAVLLPTLSTTSPRLFPLSYLSLLFFHLWTEGGISYIWKCIYGAFLETLLHASWQEKLWQICWETSLVYPRGKGVWHQPWCPVSHKLMETPEPPTPCPPLATSGMTLHTHQAAPPLRTYPSSKKRH